MRHAAQACTTSSDLKAAPRRINRGQRPQRMMTTFLDGTGRWGRLPAEFSRAAAMMAPSTSRVLAPKRARSRSPQSGVGCNDEVAGPARTHECTACATAYD